jgi:sugar fermentation stimulation protein A
MKFQSPLLPAILERRYKRFLADIVFNEGETVTAHVANPGSMIGMKDPGTKVWVELNNDPKRKLKYSWKLAEIESGALISVDTHLANTLVEEGLVNGKIPELAAYSKVRREVPYGENSRIDFLLEHETRPDCYVEVKSVTLRRDSNTAEFPDSVTKRGQKHLVELSNAVESGFRAVMLFVVQRNDCHRFKLAHDLDPGYFEAMQNALKVGVEVLCFGTKISYEGLELDQRMELHPDLVHQSGSSDFGKR